MVAIPEHERNHAPVSRLLSWNTINDTKIIKQADVLMIPFLFPNALPENVIKANYDYYEPITDHGSSLSCCVHAAIAARIGRLDDARRYWEKSLFFDLSNTMSNTGLGIHAAAIGGTWQALVFHLLGVELTTNGPRFSNTSYVAQLLGSRKIKLNLTYRGMNYPIEISAKRRQVA